MQSPAGVAAVSQEVEQPHVVAQPIQVKAEDSVPAAELQGGPMQNHRKANAFPKCIDLERMCTAVTKKGGERCRVWRLPGTVFCTAHRS